MKAKIVVETRDSSSDSMQEALMMMRHVMRNVSAEGSKLLFRRGMIEVDATNMKNEKEVYEAYLKERERLFKEANGLG